MIRLDKHIAHLKIIIVTLLFHVSLASAVHAQTTNQTADAPEEPTKNDLLLDIPPGFIHEDLTSLSGKKSLMYTSQELLSLYETLATLDDITVAITAPDGTSIIPLEEDDTIDEMTEIPPARDFYLNSILYYNPTSWSIWLNGEKATSNAPAENPRIEKVDKHTVRLFWQNLNMHQNMSDWTNQMQHIEGTIPFSLSAYEEEHELLTPSEKDIVRQQKIENFTQGNFEWNYQHPQQDILIDSNNCIIAFTLKTHQTFTSQHLAVVEGVINEQTIMSTRKTQIDNTLPPSTSADDETFIIDTQRDDSAGDDNFDDLISDIFNDNGA